MASMRFSEECGHACGLSCTAVGQPRRAIGMVRGWLSASFVLRILTLLLLAAGVQANILTEIGKVADEIGDAGKAATHTAEILEEISEAFRRIPHVSGRPRAMLRLEPDGLALVRETGAREVVVAAAVLHGSMHLSNELVSALHSLDVFVPDEHFFEIRPALTNLPDTTSLFVLDDNNSVTAIRRVMSEGKKALALETKPGLLIDVADLVQLRNLEWAFSQPLYRHDMRVVSLFDSSDVDVIREIGKSVGELHTPLDRLSDGGLTRSISHGKRKVYLLVGHVEGEAFVVRNASGTVTAQYTFSELDKAARASDSTVVFLGCESAAVNGVTGFVDTVNALKVAEGLANAINAATVSDAFQAISNVSGALVIRPGLGDEYRLIAEAKKRIERQERGMEIGFHTTRITTLSRARAEDLDLRLIPFFPWWIQVIYIVGAVQLLINVRSQWREWKEFWWHAPMWQRGQRSIAALSRLTRVTTFWLLMPWIMLASRCAHWIAVIGAPFAMLWSGVSGIVCAVFLYLWFRDHRELLQSKGLLECYYEFAYLVLFILVPVVVMQAVTGEPDNSTAGLLGPDIVTPFMNFILSPFLTVVAGMFIMRVMKKQSWVPTDVASLIIYSPVLAIRLGGVWTRRIFKKLRPNTE